MAEPKRHLYFDQQKPSEDPSDSAKPGPSIYEFARRPPSNEDDYFYEQGRRKRLRHPSSEVEVRRNPLIEKARSEEPAQPADHPRSIWQRVYQAFAKRFDFSWRP